MKGKKKKNKPCPKCGSRKTIFTQNGLHCTEFCRGCGNIKSGVK